MNWEYGKLAYDEIEISVYRIIKNCIKQMKWIVVVAVLLAIVSPLIMYKKNLDEYTVLKQRVENHDFSESEMQMAETYFSLKQNVKESEDYVQNAPIMKIDFEDAYQGELQYYVEGEPATRRDVSIALKNYILGSSFLAEFCKENSGLDVAHVNELFDIRIEAGENNIIAIWVLAQTEEECAIYLDSIKALIQEKSKEFKLVIGEHELGLIQDSITSGFSTKVRDLQVIANNKVSETKSLLEQHELNLSAVDRILIEEKENGIAITSITKPVINFKLVILNFFIIIIGAVAGIALCTVYGGRLQTDKEIGKRVNLLHIGTLIKQKKTNQQKNSVEEKKIIKFLQEKNVDCIQILSTEDLSKTDLLLSMLDKAEIKYSCVDNMLKNKDAIGTLETKDPVVIIEIIGKSKIKEIYEELAYCRAVEISVLGYICINE